jgi:hypothetical protein
MGVSPEKLKYPFIPSLRRALAEWPGIIDCSVLSVLEMVPKRR